MPIAADAMKTPAITSDTGTNFGCGESIYPRDAANRLAPPMTRSPVAHANDVLQSTLELRTLAWRPTEQDIDRAATAARILMALA